MPDSRLMFRPKKIFLSRNMFRKGLQDSVITSIILEYQITKVSFPLKILKACYERALYHTVLSV